MKYKLTINDLLCGRWFLSLIALLLMSVEMQAEETSTTYTFSGMSAVSGADYQYEVTSTSGGASETWKIKNFSATDESYHNRTTSVYVFDTQSVGISNIFATSESATIIKFQLVSDFVLHGDFVSADDESYDADHILNEEGWITITPNNVDRTDYAELKRLRSFEGADL